MPAAIHKVYPGDDPQAVLDRAAPGSKLVFLPGVHSNRLQRHRSILYVDNIRIDDREGLEVVTVNSPSAWEESENLVIRNNRLQKEHR